jgi:Immunoglobulin I-set domain.
MKKRALGRLLAVLLSAAMTVSLLQSADIGGKAQAATDEWWKTVACVGTNIMKAPISPLDENSIWKGSYIWYGKYDGSPIKYRVLAPKTTSYGGTTMLLDCDTVLYEGMFDKDQQPNAGAQYANQWLYSDMRAGLNGSDFLTRADGFTALERSAIAESRIPAHTLNTGDVVDIWFEDYVALTGEKIFLLDYEDVLNPKYGYTSDSGWESENGEINYDWHPTENRIKGDKYGSYIVWWLRSAYQDLSRKEAAVVYYDGTVDSFMTDDEYGVSPAFNIDLSSVIFSSLVSGTAGQEFAEYKLTLADSNLKVGIPSGATLTASGSTITVPYTITGLHASNATQVSVLILDKPYTAGNTTNATIKYYGMLNTDVGTGFKTTGTGTFELPSGLSISGWNSKYYVYLLAEDVNRIHETDYASTPMKLSAPGYPNINTQPKNTTVSLGDTAEFTVTAVGNGTLTYQWQRRASVSSDWITYASISTSPTFSVTATSGINGFQYRCLVNDSKGNQAISDAATLTIKPKITTMPKDTTVTAGSTAKFTVAASGIGTLTYQWQAYNPNTKKWVNSGAASAKTANLSIAASAGHNGFKFRCVVTDANGNSTTSSEATLNIAGMLTITKHPASVSVAAGSKASFSVTAKGSGTLSYQWEAYNPNTKKWTNSVAASAKTAILSITTVAGHNGFKFRCVVTDGTGKSITSNEATLTVTQPLTITSQPTAKTVAVGETAKFSVTVTGKGTLTYQWQAYNPYTKKWVDSGAASAKTATLGIKAQAAHNGFKFRCNITDAAGQTATSKEVLLTVRPGIVTQPKNQKVTTGATAKFTVAADGVAPLSYQWQAYNPNTKKWTNSSSASATTATLSIKAQSGHNNFKFRCVVTDKNGNSTTSAEATLTVQ